MGFHSSSCGDDCSDTTATTVSSHEKHQWKASLSALESKVMAVVAENMRLRTDMRWQASKHQKEMETMESRLEKLEGALAKSPTAASQTADDADLVDARLRALERIVVGGQSPRTKSRGRAIGQGSSPELTYQSVAAANAVTAATRMRAGGSRSSLTKAREQRLAKSKAISQALEDQDAATNDDDVDATEISLSLSAANLCVSDADLGLHGSHGSSTSKPDDDFPILSSSSMHGSKSAKAESSSKKSKKTKKQKDSTHSSKKDLLSSQSEHGSSTRKRRSSRKTVADQDDDDDDLFSCQSEHIGSHPFSPKSTLLVDDAGDDDDDDLFSCQSGQSVASRRRAARQAGLSSSPRASDTTSSLLPPMTIQSKLSIGLEDDSALDAQEVELCRPVSPKEWADAQAADDKLQQYLKNPGVQNMYPKFYLSAKWVGDAYLYLFRKRVYVPEPLRQRVMEHYWDSHTGDDDRWSTALCKDKIWPTIDADITNFRSSRH